MTLRVLCVDDSPDDAELNILALERHGFMVDGLRVDEREAARVALAGQKWDLILCDYSMPRFSAIGLAPAATVFTPSRKMA